MSTLAEPKVRAAVCVRIASLQPDSLRRWGRMTAHEMICHLNDSFRVASGAKYASSNTNLFKRTIMKWAALRTPVPWPKGVPTRPELIQGQGGTPPVDWIRDRSELEEWVPAFAARESYGLHPIFGKMSKADWLIWAYRHVDHHLRQFSV